jgi:kynureninase
LEIFDRWPASLNFSLGSPRDPGKRGSHVVLRHPQGRKITAALIHPLPGRIRVIPDFRSPDHIRIGIAPLYNSFMDICLGMQRIREVVESEEYGKNN